jgi:fructokinase
MLIPHDRTRDPFAGACPYHGDCFEGLASGSAIGERWGRRSEELGDRPEVWELEAEYLALGVVNVICVVSPQRVILGGGVMKQPSLLPLVRVRTRELLNGYVARPELADGLDEYIVGPALGDRAGVLGAIELARLAREAGV